MGIQEIETSTGPPRRGFAGIFLASVLAGCGPGREVSTEFQPDKVYESLPASPTIRVIWPAPGEQFKGGEKSELRIEVVLTDGSSIPSSIAAFFMAGKRQVGTLGSARLVSTEERTGIYALKMRPPTKPGNYEILIELIYAVGRPPREGTGRMGGTIELEKVVVHGPTITVRK